ncbi:HNH endonuclease [Spelaeicoccus albus]|uniref:Putative restriction endonuclease n=1 Tax=Spelaeicoccus albus TaxID=1280376 RepID=A0A7Z0AB88_9MICO|nr:HNH endonuclease [Spelaeicoccus albus]NYI67023.1 putative restriction endonuclease [Spelaeicoccus albus]
MTFVGGRDGDWEDRAREAAFQWLDEHSDDEHPLFERADLASWTFEGKRIALIDRQRGIRKPAEFRAALSIMTTFTPPGQTPPYEDAAGDDGLLRYKYRGKDAAHPENRALRNAMAEHVPLIWFTAVEPGRYLAVRPVWIVDDNPRELEFSIAVDSAQYALARAGTLSDERSYAERLTQQRLHQPLFRARVLSVYHSECAICHLNHAGLLDAAHIIEDGKPNGLPVVPNGLSMCKIHHAAYDRNIIGVRPDAVVEVRTDILHEIDGPMLKYGIQQMHGARLTLPGTRAARPDPERLEARYEEFRSAVA